MKCSPHNLKQTAFYSSMRLAVLYTVSVLPVGGSSIPPVLIFAEGRTGSTLLEYLLVSTGYFDSYGEIIETDKYSYKLPVNYVKGVRKWKKMTSQKSMLCHVKHWHLEHEGSWQSVEDLISYCMNDKWLIIFLQRENRGLQALSGYIAWHSGRYHLRINEPTIKKMHVDPEKLRQRIKRLEIRASMEEEWMRGVPNLRLTYEQHLLNSNKHQKTVDTVLNRLGVARRTVKTDLRKSIPSLREVVINYEEIEQLLHSCGYEV